MANDGGYGQGSGKRTNGECDRVGTVQFKGDNMRNNIFTGPLNDICQKDLSRVGGKAANLGEMIKSGLPVPEGFVITVGAYKKFLIYNKIEVEIKKLLVDLENTNLEETKKISSEIKNLFQQSKIPADLLTEIDQSYDRIGNPEVVVRSSGTMEDSPVTSFAGQYDSFLNVKGKEGLNKYIKLCWASLWNARALSYRLKEKIDNNKLAHGVIIQKLIRAEKSGVLFTVNPLNNRRDQVLINSSWGLGETLVSGNVTPDQWIVDKKERKILKEKIAVKEKMSVLKDKGTKLVNVPVRKRKQPSLDHNEVYKLLELVEKAEDFFDLPQDIEWACRDNEFYLVQSRPITTLFPKLEPEDSDGKLRIYINFLLIDKVIPEPLTPIGEDIWKKLLQNILPMSWVKSAVGRLFVDTTEISRLERWWGGLRNNPFAMDPLTIETILEVLKRNKAKLEQQKKPLIKLIPTLFCVMSPSFFKFLLTSIPKALYGVLSSPEKVVEGAYSFGENQVKSLEQKRRKLHTKEEKINFIEKNILPILYFIPLKILYYAVRSPNYLDKAKKLINKYLDDASRLNKVKKSLPHNVTTEMGMELLRIARKIDQSGGHLSPEGPEIKEFLNQYGHRTYLEIDPGIPRWKDDPEYIINLLQSYISNKSYNERIKKFHQGKEEAEKTIQDITARLKEKGARKDARKVEKLLENYRKTFGVRELPKYIMSKGVRVIREILLEVGEELVAEERLDDKEDIFFVRLKDIKSEGKLQPLVIQNREAYQKELKRNSIPRVVTSTGETIFSVNESEEDNGYDGIPVSPGVYEGQVKVLETPEDGNQLKKGDILVTKATSPAWTPLFLEIGGLITEMGGPMSHGSVVAREYGIPAIVGIREATTRFKDGQFIRLNGETGKIEIIT
ncbi:hypothetical protein KGY79_03955 [Candidatus Bipolaricaulota bacterium]|nr:hypothetical protein [Candidatus Bipolaricaulota bacterium]